MAACGKLDSKPTADRLYQICGGGLVSHMQLAPAEGRWWGRSQHAAQTSMTQNPATTRRGNGIGCNLKVTTPGRFGYFMGANRTNHLLALWFHAFPVWSPKCTSVVSPLFFCFTMFYTSANCQTNKQVFLVLSFFIHLYLTEKEFIESKTEITYLTISCVWQGLPWWLRQ